MNKRLLLISSCLFSVLVGCSSPGQRDDLPPVTEPGYPDEESAQPYPAEGQEPVQDSVPEESVTPPPPSTSSAVQSLINKSRSQYQMRDYQGAIATAERGLRIDRRSAELYLLLAQSYVQLAMPQQAEQFAKQGLRYSESGSSVAEGLLRVREILTGSNL